MLFSSGLLLMIFLSNWPTTSGLFKLQSQLESFDQIGLENILKNTGARIRKFNRTTTIVNGTFSVLTNLDDSYEFSIAAARSALGNNQFNEYPMKLARTKSCTLAKNEYVEYQHMWKRQTNLPMFPLAGNVYCPFPKGDYWVKEFVSDVSWVPPVIPEGFWRMTFTVHGPGDVIEGKIVIFAKLWKEYVGK